MSAPAEAPAPLGTRLVLLRHGRTEWNRDGRFQGQLDIPLDPAGRAQAAAAAPVIARLAPTVAVCSDLQRTRDTAAAVAGVTGLPATPDPRLREIYLGAWQGLTPQQAAEQFPEEYAAWARGEQSRRGGGETYAEVAIRALDLLAGLLAGGGTVLAVTHGGTGRSIVGSLLGLPPDHWFRFAALGNCQWSLLAMREPGWQLLGHGMSAAVGD